MRAVCLGFVLILAGVACGGDSESSAPDAHVAQRSTILSKPFTITGVSMTTADVAVSAAGVLDGTVSWTPQADGEVVFVILSDGACTNPLCTGIGCPCQIAASNKTAGEQPKKIMANVTAQTYKLWLYSSSSTMISGTIEIGLTR